jgi:hypothetical protein
MLSNFKKLGVAAAVATALGASGAAQAVILGQPGDALLVQYVWSTGPGQVNTMISLINASAGLVDVADFATLSGTKVDDDGDPTCNGELHWFFYDYMSVEKANGFIDVTCEDWVGIDWASVVFGPGPNWRPDAQFKRGYLVITDAAANDAGTGSSLILYGTAFQIRGDWQTQAFIPVLPLLDDGGTADEVAHGTGPVGGFLTGVNPVTAGMPLAGATGETAVFSLRYYLQTTAPEGSTEFVLWFPENSDGSYSGDPANTTRESQGIVVYDPDENPNSAATSIPYELNVLLVSPTAGPADVDPEAGGYTGYINGSLHPVTGYVVFGVDDYNDSPIVGSRGGVAFSLIGVNGANAVQVQTELAHERGVFGAVGGVLAQ